MRLTAIIHDFQSTIACCRRKKPCQADVEMLTSTTRKPYCPAAWARWTIARPPSWSGCATEPPRSCDCAREHAPGTTRRCPASPPRSYRGSGRACSDRVPPADLQFVLASNIRSILHLLSRKRDSGESIELGERSASRDETIRKGKSGSKRNIHVY